MRILQLYKDYAPVVGGIENHIRVLAEGLQGQGHQVQVLVTNQSRTTQQEKIGNVDVYKAARWLAISSAPISGPFYPALRRLARDCDIAHAHAPYPPGELGQLWLGSSRRFVLTYHSDIVRQRLLGFLYGPFLRRVLHAAHGIIVSNPVYIHDSPFLASHAAKCRVIPFGIDLDRFAATPAVATRAAQIRAHYDARPLILFTGQFRHYKGVDVLIEAMQDPALQQIDAQLLIVGQGPLGAAWQTQVADAGLGQRIAFLGNVDDAELVALYHAAQVFALPSTNRAETLGIVQIEAMACGTPLVCTELGTGTTFVNQHMQTGLVVPPHDAPALAAALHRILTEPELAQRMGAAGRARAATVFAAPAMIQQTIDYYRELLDA
ncbi:MAG: glycosyltransferase [Litorilinea sp.]